MKLMDHQTISNTLQSAITGFRKAVKLLAPTLILAIASAIAGTGSVYAQTNPNEAQGLTPYDTLHGGDLDSVSMTNGGLTLKLPLVSFPQRGSLDLSFFVRYSSKNWQLKYGVKTSPRWVPAPNTGVQIVSSVDWWMQTSSALTDSGENTWSRGVTSPDGATHQLGGSFAPVFPLRSLDATGLLHPDNTTLIMPNGTRYSYPFMTDSRNTGDVTGITGNYVQGVQPSVILDANGNQININASGSALGWVDTMNRTIPGSISPASKNLVQPGVPTNDLSQCPAGTTSALVWNIPGVAGVNNGVRTYWFCYTNTPVTSPPADLGVAFNGTISLLTAIVLPNSTKWTFAYDGYGDLKTLVFPTGGSISYTYQAGPATCTPDRTQHSQWVATRTVDARDGTGPHIWTYTYNGQLTKGPTGAITGYAGTATVTSPPTLISPNGDDTVHAVTTPIQNALCSLYVTQTQYYQGLQATGTLLKTTSTQFSGNAYIGNGFTDGAVATNVVPSQETITIGGRTKKVVDHYDPDPNDLNNPPITNADGQPVIIGSLLQTDEYDYSGVLQRSLVHRYQWQENTPYKTYNFVSLVSSSTLFDGSGTKSSQTRFGYDDTTRLSASMVTVQHTSMGDMRGNLNYVSRWVSTSDSMVTSIANYYDTGMKYQDIDPANHVTTYSYAPEFYGTYQTQTDLPNTQMPDTGAPVVSHRVSGTYDFNTGLLTRFTDQNAQSYTYEYRDLMLRLTKATHPDFGETDFIFPDANTVERKTKIVGTTFADYFSYFDGVGRSYKNKQLDASGNLISQVDINYDALGRIASISNPYSSTTEPTYGLMQYQYDALGRTLRTTKQDGSISLAVYNDNANVPVSLDCTTATDEAGKMRRMCTDFAGRLAEVDEPGGDTTGTSAYGQITIGGALKTTTTGGTGATPATGSITIAGTEHSLTTTTAGTQAKINITIGGSDGNNNNCVELATGTKCTLMKDSGSVSIVVNAGGSTFSPTPAGYDATVNPTRIAQSLAASVPSNSAFNTSAVTTNPDGTATFTLTTTAANSSANLSTAAVKFTSNCVATDTVICGPQGWTVTFSGPALASTATSPSKFSGGKDGTSSTIYDSGSVGITVNGHLDQVSFGQGDNTGTIATNLANRINGDLGAFVTATPAGAIVQLTAKNTGNASNYTLSSSYTFDTTNFSSPGPSFTSSNSGANLTGGKDGSAGTTVTDAGTVTLSIGSFSVQACYGPGGTCTAVPSCPSGDSTAAQVACVLTQRLNSAADSPVSASVIGSTINVTYKNPGTAGNVSIVVNDTSNNPTVFPGGSFSSPGATLSGGVDPQPATLNTPYVTTYQYNARNNLVCVHQKASDATPDKPCADPTVPSTWRPRNFTYDSLSRLLTSDNPEKGRLTYTYDTLGRLSTKTDARNITATYSYDDLSRLLGISYSDITPSVSYRYDYASYQGQTFDYPVGRRVAANSTNGTSSFSSYDSMGRIKKTVECIPGTTCQTFNSSYDLSGELRTLSYPSGLNLTYGYDDAGRVTSVADSSGLTYASNPTYLPTGMIQQFSTPNITYHTDFNNRLQPVETWAKTNAATVLFDKTYQYDPAPGAHQNNGDVLSITNVKDATRTQTFTYDALNRLATAGDQTHWANSYTYDAWGNLTQKNAVDGRPPGESLSLTADSHNHVFSQTATLSYDAAGNLLNDGVSGFIYDAESRIGYSATGGVITTYTYDADGRRVKKSSAPETNLALGKPATQSSTFVLSPYPSGDASKAVDGNADGNYSNASVSSTNGNFQAWWQVDLGAVQPIDKITIWNRTDCCQDRLSNLYVLVSDQPFNSTDLSATISQSSVSSYYISSLTQSSVMVGIFRTARYVRVQLAGNNFLSLAEVQVLGLANGTATSSATNYWYAPDGEACAESDGVGNFTDYVFYAGQRLVRKISSDVKYYITDHLHSTAVLADKSGTVLDDNDLYPWGGVVRNVGSSISDNHYKFTGKERDPETGLDYFGARYYSSSLGRWSSADWSSIPRPVPYADLSDPASLNLYSYVRNRPTTLIDDDGHEDTTTKNKDGSTTTVHHNPPKTITSPKQGVGGGTFIQTTLTTQTTVTETRDEQGNLISSKVQTTSSSTTTTTNADGSSYQETTGPIITTSRIEKQDGQITVNGVPFGDQSAGTTVETVTSTIACAMDPASCVVENGGKLVGQNLDKHHVKNKELGRFLLRFDPATWMVYEELKVFGWTLYKREPTFDDALDVMQGKVPQ